MTRIDSGLIGGLTGVGAVQFDANTDQIDVLIASVQLNRADLIENQLRDQIKTVQARNEAIGSLNDAKSALGAQKAYIPADQTGSLIDQKHYKDQMTPAQVEQFNRDWAADPSKTLETARNGGYGKGYAELADAATKARDAGLDDQTVSKIATGKITSAEIDATSSQITGKIDNLSSSQQIEMIRLQSLSQRRAEAFDVATNSLKKMSDNKSNVISNLR